MWYKERITISSILGSNNLYGCVVPQKLPVNNFEWIKNISQFNEDLLKNFDEESYKEYFLKGDVQYNENFVMIYYFYQKVGKLEKVEELVASLCD